MGENLQKISADTGNAEFDHIILATSYTENKIIAWQSSYLPRKSMRSGRCCGWIRSEPPNSESTTFTCQISLGHVNRYGWAPAHAASTCPDPLTTRTPRSAVGVLVRPGGSRGCGDRCAACTTLGRSCRQPWLNPLSLRTHLPGDRDRSPSPSAAGHKAHVPAGTRVTAPLQGAKEILHPAPCEQYLAKTWETTQWNKLILSPNPQIIHPELKTMYGSSLRNTSVSISLI